MRSINCDRSSLNNGAREVRSIIFDREIKGVKRRAEEAAEEYVQTKEAFTEYIGEQRGKGLRF
jgi:hypothetical protein